MKNNKLKMLCALTLAATIIVGCVTRNPSYNAQLPNSADNQPYVVDTNGTAKVNAALAKLENLNQATAGFDPYSVPISGVLTGIGAAIALATGAAVKIRNAFASNKAATQTLAKVVANSPLASTAVMNAPDSATAAIVQQHIYEQQIIGGAAKVTPTATAPS